MKPLYIALMLAATSLLQKGCEAERFITEQEKVVKDTVTVSTPDESVTYFTSNDLTFFEVHGHVKSITDDYNTMKFNEKGELVTVDDKDPFTESVATGDDYVKYTRTAGMIVGEERAESTMLEYTWEDNRLSACDWTSDSWIGHQTYKYDNKGLLVEMVTNQQDFGELPETVTGKYVYNKFDDHQNWLQRTIYANDTVVERRTIKYYSVEEQKD